MAKTQPFKQGKPQQHTGERIPDEFPTVRGERRSRPRLISFTTAI